MSPFVVCRALSTRMTPSCPFVLCWGAALLLMLGFASPGFKIGSRLLRHHTRPTSPAVDQAFLTTRLVRGCSLGACNLTGTTGWRLSPGFCVFDSLYIHMGDLVMAPGSSTVVKRGPRNILATDSDSLNLCMKENDPVRLRMSSPAPSVVLEMPGTTMIMNYGVWRAGQVQYFHQLEYISGAWVAHMADLHTKAETSNVTHVIFIDADRKEVFKGLQSTLLRLLFPDAQVLCKDQVADFGPSIALRLERAVLVDRQAAHLDPRSSEVNKMQVGQLEYAWIAGNVQLAKRMWEGVAASELNSAVDGAADWACVGGRRRRRVTYVSRQAAATRHFDQAVHSQLILALRELTTERCHDMSVATLEELPFMDQVRLMSNSDVVVGIHGNGLTHVAWMPENSTLIEIFPPVGLTLDFDVMARLRDIRHIMVRQGNSDLPANTSVDFSPESLNKVDSEMGVQVSTIMEAVARVVSNDCESDRREVRPACRVAGTTEEFLASLTYHREA